MKNLMALTEWQKMRKKLVEDAHAKFEPSGVESIQIMLRAEEFLSVV